MGKHEIRGFRAILAEGGRWHSEKSRNRAENGQSQFPGGRGPEIKKKVTTVSGVVVRNFFTFYVLADRTPMGGKSQNMGLLDHVALGTERNPGSGPKSGKHKFLVSARKCAIILTFSVFADRTPTGAKYGGFRPFWPKTALGTQRSSRRKTEKHKQPH